MSSFCCASGNKVRWILYISVRHVKKQTAHYSWKQRWTRSRVAVWLLWPPDCGHTQPSDDCLLRMCDICILSTTLYGTHMHGFHFQCTQQPLFGGYIQGYQFGLTDQYKIDDMMTSLWSSPVPLQSFTPHGNSTTTTETQKSAPDYSVPFLMFWLTPSPKEPMVPTDVRRRRGAVASPPWDVGCSGLDGCQQRWD